MLVFKFNGEYRDAEDGQRIRPIDEQVFVIFISSGFCSLAIYYHIVDDNVTGIWTLIRVAMPSRTDLTRTTTSRDNSCPKIVTDQ